MNNREKIYSQYGSEIIYTIQKYLFDRWVVEIEKNIIEEVQEGHLKGLGEES